MNEELRNCHKITNDLIFQLKINMLRINYKYKYKFICR